VATAHTAATGNRAGGRGRIRSGPVNPASAPAAPVESAIKYPVEDINAAAGTASAPLPALSAADKYVSDAVASLLGRKEVLTFLQLDGFVRRVVATVDNLAREHAPVSIWPVNPTPGRFTTGLGDNQDPAGETTINPDNSLRYSPFVIFVESIDSVKTVALYARLYPLFQQAYVELGYPKGYFNDRLVAVVDLLLATPVQTGPISVNRVDVKGPLQPTRPWLTYEFTDPALEALSAGQKMLIRSGSVNHRRLQKKLLEFRRLLAAAPLAQPANPAQQRVRTDKH